MPQIDPDGIHIIEDRALVVYDPQVREHTPAGYITDPVTGELVPSGKIVQLPASAIPLSGDAGNSLTLSPVDGKLYVAPTAVINVADDQGLTASETSTALVKVNSTSVASTVDGVAETTVNHDFHVDVKVAPTPASGVQNSLKVTTSGLYVAKEVLGEGTPPVSNGRPSLSTRYFGDPAILMGTPLGWVDLAELHSDGSTTLYTLGYFKKVVVPAGEKVFTYVPPSEETPPMEEVPPEEETPPSEGGETPTQFDLIDVVNQATAVPSKFQGFVEATNAVKAAEAKGTIAPITNFNDAATHIYNFYKPLNYRAAPGSEMTSAEFVDYIEFLHLVGFDVVDLSGFLEVIKGTGYPALPGSKTLSTVVNSVPQYLRVNEGANAHSALIWSAFTWTTDAAQASGLSNDAVNLFLTAFGFVAYRNNFGGGNHTPFLGTQLTVN